MSEDLSPSGNGVRFSVLDWNQLQQALLGFCFEIRRSAAAFRKNSQAQDQAVLNKVSALILQKTAPEAWDAEVARQFLALVLDVLQQQVGHSDLKDAAIISAIQRQADIVCSIVAQCPQVTENERIRSCRLLFRSRLLAGLPSAPPQEWLAEATESMKPVGLSTEVVSRQAMLQYVIRASFQQREGTLAEPIPSLARNWCAELVAMPEFSGLLKTAAGVLQVEIPATSQPAAPALEPPAVTVPAPVPQGMFQLPEPLPDTGANELRNMILIQLYAQSGVSDSPLSGVTKSQVNGLLPDTPTDQLNRTFFYACNDLWRGYWKTGNVDLLDIIRTIAHFLIAAPDAVTASVGSNRSNAVQLSIAAQLPDFLLTCDIPRLLEAIRQLCRQVKVTVNDFAIRQIIIEAFAGQCRRLDKENNPDDKAALLKDYGPDLRKIHLEYESGTSDFKSSAWIKKSREDERAAWEYLFPSVPKQPPVQTVEEKNTGGSFVPPPPPPPSSRILDDDAFCKIVRGGEHSQIFEYVEQNRDTIEDLLRRRLGVKLTSDNLMEPEGTIRETWGTKERQENIQFREGCEALQQGNFPAAKIAFKRLADRMEGFARQIANNYLAYAEAKTGDPLEGRRLLNLVCESNFTFPSAYWNLACCLPSTEIRQQLDAIAKGLEVSPQPKLLDAAIYLGVFLHDERLRGWLPCHTKAEALLLYYHLIFEESEGSERERHLMQLAAYLRNGEPSGPDPTRINIQREKAWTYVNALLDAQQPEAIEFWLRCRQISCSRRYDFWEIKTDYYEKTNRYADAALSFCEELTCRLQLVRIRLRPPNELRDSDLRTTARIVRERSQKWLERCMTVTLRPTGVSICNRLKTFEEWYEQTRQSRPTLPLLQIIPTVRRLREFYGLDEIARRDDGNSNQDPKKGENADPRQPKKNLSEVLTVVGAACLKDLHDASCVVMVRPAIDQLIEALRQRNAVNSSTTLLTLLKEWGSYGGNATEEDRRTALGRANAAFSEIQRKLKGDLSPQEFILATPLISAMRRVNERLVRDLQLLPEIVIGPVEGDLVLTDLQAPKPEIAVRVRNVADSHGSSARLVGAQAVLSDGDELRPRDNFSLFTTSIEPGGSAVLAFGVDNPAALMASGKVSIGIIYNCLGTEIHAPAVEINIGHLSCPELPISSPYIVQRPIEPHEVAEHFFGRDTEQDEILASVSNGQERIRYIEGIRRSGKSSLLNSIIHRIAQNNLPLIPVYWSLAAVGGLEHPGMVLHNGFVTVCRDQRVAAAGAMPPDLENCISNPIEAYDSFERTLSSLLPEERVLLLVDDFQELIKAAAGNRDDGKPAFSMGVLAILNLIRANARPRSRLLWVFSGQDAARRYRDNDRLPGCLLWAAWKALPIDFLGRDAVRDIVTRPLKDSAIVVPQETIERIYYLTSGHPEAIQQISEIMLNHAREKRCWILAPADADEAGQQLASESDDSFADTWFPIAELKDEQIALVASLVNAIPVGGQIELFKLAANNQITDELRGAQDDLCARKILSINDNGTIGVRAPVLDLWLHRNWIKRVHAAGAFNGNAAIFIDVANLTKGKGESTLTDLDTSIGEGLPGRFSLSTVIDHIEDYVRQLTPAPVAARWASNYPRGCPAILVCDNKDFYNVNVPEDLWTKGSDDTILMLKVRDVQQQYRRLNHFILVTGDKDYRVLIHELLQNGHFAHVISRASSLGRPDTKFSYDRLAQEFPQRFNVMRLEDLLENANASAVRVK